MLRKLVLERFKSFEHAEMTFGPFTVVVGPNASGKSNLRDALRFLHGIGQGNSLAEIIGEKWGEGGVLQWRGMRGGLREIAFNGAGTFALEVCFDLGEAFDWREAVYRIEVDVSQTSTGPRVAFESYTVSKELLFEAIREVRGSESQLKGNLPGRREFTYPDTRPVLPQIANEFRLPVPVGVRINVAAGCLALVAMRFLDLNPDSMRVPSTPGQVVLGDQGENLSSVLQGICADRLRNPGILEWVRELTPMDVVDFEFPADQAGRVLTTLVEQSGRRISAYSASDGTLRFLAILAALLGQGAGRFYFFEELENGLHPTRLALLMQLIEQQTSQRRVQVVATTHSPQLLGLLGAEARSHAVESYRLENAESTSLARLMDLPDAERIISEQGLARLHASGWIEDAVEFSAPEAA
ncbi:MAG TPA: AAA family ATPase [Longimicrobium sp.]|nr:AAA family ATPase [Longimicrobium sp.]